MTAGLFGYFLYLIFPAAGPLYLTGRQFPGSPFPFSELRSLLLRGHVLRMIPISQDVCRNAMPSLHMTWALLMAFNCKPFPRLVRALAVMYVFATVLGTLGTGEHYLIDLVVAFPFAVAVQALGTHSLPLKSPQSFGPARGRSHADSTLAGPAPLRHTPLFSVDASRPLGLYHRLHGSDCALDEADSVCGAECAAKYGRDGSSDRGRSVIRLPVCSVITRECTSPRPRSGPRAHERYPECKYRRGS